MWEPKCAQDITLQLITIASEGILDTAKFEVDAPELSLALSVSPLQDEPAESRATRSSTRAFVLQEKQEWVHKCSLVLTPQRTTITAEGVWKLVAAKICSPT